LISLPETNRLRLPAKTPGTRFSTPVFGNNTVEWRRDLLPPEVPAGSTQGDSGTIAFDTSVGVQNLEFTVQDFGVSVSNDPIDSVILKYSTPIAGTITISGTGTPLDISNWNDDTLHNLQEAIAGIGILPVANGNGWDPVNFQASGAASVPEPSTFGIMGLGLLGMAGYNWRRRRKAT